MNCTLLKQIITVWVIVVTTTLSLAQEGSMSRQVISDLQNSNQDKQEASIANISASSQTSLRLKNNVITITGVRFTYPLVQKWIDEYTQINPEVQIIIESRGSHDPAKYDILVEAYEPDEEARNSRKYLYVARYAILPVANSQSAFSRTYSVKGLNRELIRQLFFYDILSDKKETVKEPYTIYTRLQKAGSPITFSSYFGYQQKDIQGKSIAGADEHLLKAVLRDSTALTYLPLNFLYDLKTGKPISGITILPVDLNGNGKLNEDEKIFDQLSTVFERLEGNDPRKIQNIPTGHIHLSVDSNNANAVVYSFLHWVLTNGAKELHAFGFFKPDPSRVEGKQSDWILKENDE
jgi:ABC-type phosphate transport system substrate-binding protein